MRKKIVVKVGGSLLQWGGLRTALISFLRSYQNASWIIVAGGGITADVIRYWDQIHQLGEESSHWLAIAAMRLNGQLLADLLSTLPLGVENTMATHEYHILDPELFFRGDDAEEQRVPRSWMATSDTLAARVAEAVGADELVLLKSKNAPQGTIHDWAKASYVDSLFPTTISRAGIPVNAFNLMEWPIATEATTTRPNASVSH